MADIGISIGMNLKLGIGIGIGETLSVFHTFMNTF